MWQVQQHTKDEHRLNKWDIATKSKTRYIGILLTNRSSILVRVGYQMIAGCRQ